MLFALALVALSTAVAAAPNAVADSFANPQVAQFKVKTSQLPLFNGIKVQDSYAGRLALKGNLLGDKYSFWYYPADTKSKKLTIWLNGGPGCSSLEGLSQENGPWMIPPGANQASLNPYSWTTASDMLYIEQPAGTGYSTGSDSDLFGEVALADDFYTFLQAFYDVFSELRSKDLYITGESYAGFYIPYITKRILEAQDSPPLGVNLRSIMINDGVYSDYIVSEQAPTYRFAALNAATLGFNSSYLKHLRITSQQCGYEALLNSVTYPQKKPIPLLLPEPNYLATCDIFDDMVNEATAVNPCFNIYRITDVCPTPVDIISNGAYFSRPDVQAAIHEQDFVGLPGNTGNSSWLECSNQYPFVNQTDVSPFTETILPGILAKIPVILWHGLTDAILLSEGDRLTIQNMTWNGQRGFSSKPNSVLRVDGAPAGIWHTERGLSYAEIPRAGHMIPEDQGKTSLAIFKAFLAHGNLANGNLSHK